MAQNLKRDGAPTVALFPWGDVIEEFLDPIGLTLDDFAARMTGGWLFGYIAALQAAGWHAVILCASARVDRPIRLIHAGSGATLWAVPGALTSNSRPSRRSLMQWWRTPWRAFVRVLRTEHCSAVLVQEYEYARFDALVVLTHALRLPIFATFQGGDRTASGLEARVRPWSLRACQGLVVASARERARLAIAYPRLPLRIADIQNPLDTEEWRPQPRGDARRKLALPDEAFIVIHHGRIDIHRKGLDVLIDAWRQFSAMRPDARLVLIGSGQDDAVFGRLLTDVSGVSWISGYVTDRVVIRRWLAAADAYVIASRTEGMPVAPLEAMACGLPVVASEAQGLPDIFADGEESGGILVPCEDAAGIARSLMRLADSPKLRQELGRAARARVEARFSISAVGRALAEFMLPQAAGRARRRADRPHL